MKTTSPSARLGSKSGSPVARPWRLLLGAFMALAAAAVPAMAKTASRPNIIVILADDVGYGDIAAHGNPVIQTPNLDRLRSQSVRFRDFHSAPYCTPTRSQLITGRDALANGATLVVAGRSFIRPEIPTMPEMFAAAGYRTGMFGKWHLGDNAPHRPHDRGFQEAKYHLGWGLTAAPEMENDYFDGYYRHRGEVKRFNGFCTDFWFDEAMSWMRQQQGKGDPFLCYLPLNAAHGPFWAPKAAAAPYAKQDPTIAAFYGLIANLDENIGRLEGMLRETGLLENTIVVFLTDNGTAAGEKVFNAGMRGRKGDVYDGGHRVPSFVRWPGGALRVGEDISRPAQMQDILPTLLELCAVPASQQAKFDGRSLVPLLRANGGDFADRKFVVQLHTKKDQAVVVWNQWRWVVGQALYDIVADPGQQQDLAAKHPEIARELGAYYEAWWQQRAPALAEYVPISIGSPLENPVRLSSSDWQDVIDPLSGGAQAVRQVPGAFRGGPWNVLVQREGDYEVKLYRWPPEAAAAIRGGLPEKKPSPASTGRPIAAGRALPIERAQVQIAGQSQELGVGEGDVAATFRLRLPAGRTQLQGWFTDDSGKDLCGAYYATVTAL